MMKNRFQFFGKQEILTGGMSFLFLWLFSYTTSPLFPYSYGWDSAFFQLVGAGMTKGYLPYRDFYDMKGPWLFLIEYAGQRLIYGRMGVFLLQGVSLWLTLSLCRKISERYFDVKGIWRQMLTSIPFFLIFAVTMEGGNLTEEWSLPFLFFSLYLSLPYLLEERKEHSPLHAFAYGCCFGILALIRITNTVLICAVMLIMFISLSAARRWKDLIINFAAFLLGIAAAFVPPLLYFGIFGEIKDMLYCTFIFGFQYGTEGFGWGTGAIFLLTLIMPVFIFVVCGVKNIRVWILLVLYVVGTCVALGMGNITLHDYTLILPGVMLGIWQLAGTLQENRQWRGRLLACLALSVCLAYPCYKFAGGCREIVRQASDRSDYDYAKDVAELIPPEDYESVWGYGIPLRWYVIADIMPYNKYCGWQDHYIELSEKVRSEIMDMLRNEPPRWIVTKAPPEIKARDVEKELRGAYTVFYENEEFMLWGLEG